MKILKSLLLMLFGFALYPALFVPVGVKFFPTFMEWWANLNIQYWQLWSL